MDTPPIAEKVKFWEEQDRINQELIPRVIKVHETLTGHIEGHDSAAAYFASLEARLAELERRVSSARWLAISASALALVCVVAALALGLAK